ncbi:PAS domain S-box protein [Halorubrum amylolyticum]|uniref:PAS domain S-box protein n=1 Tax=Halorubrum amylolyticum TaxID=2508724 RepID=UPI001F5125B4|nr:PAS domain-containing protein [Halorubrum amylolyticum]
MSRGHAGDDPPGGEFFASVVEESADPIVSVDGDGAIVHANPAAETALGRDAASLADRRLAELIPDGTADRPAASLRDRLRDRLGDPARLVDAGDVAVPLATTDGEIRAFSARFHAHDVGGETAYTGVFRERSAGDRDDRRTERARASVPGSRRPGGRLRAARCARRIRSAQ